MDGLGFVILFAFAYAVVFLMRRARSGAPLLPKNLWASRVVTSTELDLPEQIARAVLSGSRAGSMCLAVPRHVHLSVPADEMGFVTEEAQGISDRTLGLINSRGPAVARRKNTEFRDIDSLDFSSGVVTGAVGVIATFAKKANPFLTMPREPASDRPVGREQGPLATAVINQVEIDAPMTQPMPPPTTPPLKGTRYTIEIVLDGHMLGSMIVRAGQTPVETLIGRESTATFVLPPMGGISGRHLVIRLAGGEFWVIDESRYGTWLALGAEWVKLSPGERTHLVVPAKLSLDELHGMVVTVRLAESLP